MIVSDVTGILRDHITGFAIAAGFVLILCTVVRHEYGKKGLPIMFVWLLVSVVLSALGVWIEQAWGHWPARIYSIVFNVAIVSAIVIWTKRRRTAERQRSSERAASSGVK